MGKWDSYIVDTPVQNKWDSYSTTDNSVPSYKRQTLQEQAKGMFDSSQGLVDFSTTGLLKSATGEGFGDRIRKSREQKIENSTTAPFDANTQRARNPINQALEIGGQAYGGMLGDIVDMATSPIGLVTSGGGAVKKALTPKPKDFDTILRKNATVYRQVLRPSAGDVTKVEVRGKRDLNDSYRLAAREKLIIEEAADGKIDTSKARTILSGKTSSLENKLDEALSSDKTAKFSLEDVRKKAISNLDDVPVAKTKNQMIAEVNDFIDAQIADNGGDLLDGSKLNRFKSGLWKIGYNQMAPTAKESARKVGNAAKELIESGYDDFNIKGLNEELGRHYTLNTLLENASTRMVNSGKLGRMAGGIVGSVVGSTTGPVGALLGNPIGQAVVKSINSPSRITTSLANKLKGMPRTKIDFRKPQVPAAQAVNMTDPVSRGVVEPTKTVIRSKGINPVKGAALASAVALGISGQAQASELKEPERLKLSPQDFTMKEEGFRSKIYKDTKKKRTVGHGFNIEEPSIRKMIPLSVLQGNRELTEAESKTIFNRIYPKAVEAAKRYAGDKWGGLTANQKKALSDMSYQLGENKLGGFKELKKAILAGDKKKMAREVLNSDYAKQAPNRARRVSELMK